MFDDVGWHDVRLREVISYSFDITRFKAPVTASGGVNAKVPLRVRCRDDSCQLAKCIVAFGPRYINLYGGCGLH